jgi:hydroxypyruvate reductase
LPLPADGISLQDKQDLTGKLLACGADIKEINAVRKHVSQIKGGQLARLAAPAQLATLVLSDVVGDPLDSIASGPTAPDPSTFADVQKIFRKYRLESDISEAVKNHIQQGLSGEIAETPKSGDTIFGRAQNMIIANNFQALTAARAQAEALGYHALILSSTIEGETREAAKMHAAIAKEIRWSGNPVKTPACVISGGETTVTLRGPGKGGRNQEFALAAAISLAYLDAVVILSAGTDGTDGPTDAAGAICDGQTLMRAKKLNLDAQQHLDNNDAYPFFKALNDLIITGPTNTNVMDLRIILVGVA